MKEWWSEKEVAQYLGRSIRTVQDWRAKGIGPTYYKQVGCVRYLRKDVEAWGTTLPVLAKRNMRHAA